jgi:hypothetical protein
LPKFRDRTIVQFEIHSVDDCLLRYIGNLEDIIKAIRKKLHNPIIIFQEGIQIIISFPLYLLSWFGIIPEKIIAKTKDNLFYKILAGIAGFVTFLSGLVTIILGKDQMIEFIKGLFGK